MLFPGSYRCVSLYLQIAERKCVEDNIALRVLMTRRDELRAKHAQFKQKLAQEGGNEIKRYSQYMSQQCNT
jgi:hypothetical protein